MYKHNIKEFNFYCLKFDDILNSDAITLKK